MLQCSNFYLNVIKPINAAVKMCKDFQLYHSAHNMVIASFFLLVYLDDKEYQRAYGS